MYDFLAGLPERLGSQFNDLFTPAAWTRMLNSLVNTAKDQITSSLSQILPRLAAKFVPGVGILTSIYDGINFLIDNAANLGAIFTSFVNSVGELAAGVAQPSRLANFTRAIVTIVQNQGLDLLLNFATSQLGLGNLRQNVKNVVSFIPNQVDVLMRRVVSTIAERITAALPGGGANGLLAGLVGTTRTFTFSGQSYTLWVAQPRTGTPQVKIARGSHLIAVLTTAMFNESVRPNSRSRLTAIVNAARAVTSNANLNAARPNVAILTTAEAETIADIVANSCSALGCFAAGTKLWTPDGYRAIEEIQPGELVFTRDEYDPNAEIVARPVEERFRRFASLLHLHIGGQVIRTTGEHPFFVYNKGWTKAAELQSWDCVLTADGQWVAVEEVYDTGEWEVVYNVRIADHHTYFVGDWGWDFSVWAHNTNGACQVDTPVDLYAVGRGRSNPDGPPKPRPGDVLIPVGSPDSTLLTPQVPPNPLGMSTFNSVDNMTAGMGPPSGARDIWMIPAGTRLPNGVMYIFDNDPTGHYTLYVAIEMTWGDFREGIRRLPWAFSQRL